ncbi:MAG: PilN domain-containing protein [Pseudomonadales bacterium]|nr:PilN domain-containing protein [Halioglobus sp.]MCP5123931.1 PilN domain-containing protein [Pseudomonadales bacterium]MCP5194112.1 PilN domain-containing protein [Pseudomonadales bacterium]
MLEKGQNWELFGYDMRHLGKYWAAAWRDLLWAHDSPVRQRLDEVVRVHSGAESACYQAGTACAGSLPSACSAVLLPDGLVLCKQIRVPQHAESELLAMLELEVRASSPFAAADTRWGWSVLARDESGIRVALAIVSASATMAYLGREYQYHDSQAQEVWVEVAGVMVVVQGFGEGLRERRYRRRLLHSAGLLVVVALLVLGMAGTAALFKGAQLQQLEQMSIVTTREAAEATRLKSLLAVANETISAANAVVALYPSPHAELARLTRLLDDGASISSFAMAGPEIRLRGRAQDAALVMQQLTDEPAYREVVAPQAISRVAEGQEQFYLNARVASEVPE